MKSRLLVVYGFAVFLLLATAVESCHTVRRSGELQLLVQETMHRISLMDNLFGNLNAADNSAQEYVLTRQPAARAAFAQRSAAIRAVLGEIAAKIGNSPVQKARLALLKELMPERLKFVADTLDIAERSGAGIALDPARASAGRRLSVRIRQVLFDLRAEEARVMGERSRAARTNTQRVSGLIFTMGLLAFNGLVISVLVLRRDVIGRVVAEATRTESLLRERQALRRTVELADELQRAHNLLRGIVEGTRDLIAAVDPDFRYLAFNTAYYEEMKEIFGLEVRVGMSIRDALAHIPEQSAKGLALWARPLAGEEFIVTEEFGAGHRKRGVYEIRCSSIRNAEGEIIGAAHVGRDVSQRWHAERALEQARQELEERISERTGELAQALASLRSSEERLRLAIDGAQIGLWQWDFSSNMVSWYGSMEELFGLSNPRRIYPRSEIVALIEPADRAMVEEAMARSMREKAP
ncbi:MAG: PAS domain-containing protein, partial [Acidobacteria bacterium]|nr:PAS domain-containing protein [Acidobacteriota bacterium]